jgi:hypothetical protein
MISEPKHQFAIPDKSVFSSIPRGLPREPTLDRLLVLSQPRDKEDRFSINETQWGQSIPISFAAIMANPSSRIEDLARPKKCLGSDSIINLSVGSLVSADGLTGHNAVGL